MRMSSTNLSTLFVANPRKRDSSKEGWGAERQTPDTEAPTGRRRAARCPSRWGSWTGAAWSGAASRRRRVTCSGPGAPATSPWIPSARPSLRSCRSPGGHASRRSWALRPRLPPRPGRPGPRPRRPRRPPRRPPRTGNGSPAASDHAAKPGAGLGERKG